MTEELAKLKLEKMLKEKHKIWLSFMAPSELKRLIDNVYKICQEDFERDTGRG